MLGFCTIITKNYLAQARVLAENLKAVHPRSPFFVLVVDNIDDYFSPSQENMQIVLLSELKLTEEKRMCFQYGLVELCTAVKPSWMEHLFQKTNITRLIYLDPDISVYGSFDEVESLLNINDLVVTPYITSPYQDTASPNEVNLLRFGTFNLGFLGVRKGEEAFRFLKWWKEKLFTGCRNDPAQGYFVDQRWMDLAPSLFDRVFILKHPGYNAAHWNFHYRFLQSTEGVHRVNGQPLIFVHFSGFRPLVPTEISVHQDRYQMDQVGQWKSLFREYAEKLCERGYRASYLWPYSFAKFKNGAAISPAARLSFLALGESAKAFPDPFETKENSFYEWFKQQPPPASVPISSAAKEKLLQMACVHVEQVNQLSS